ncbi:MAG: O-antigen ligase family protein [Actinomadura rubrobrunea]|nr:O-antigen ligase family protein [Actinomadura rubrobrunea]
MVTTTRAARPAAARAERAGGTPDAPRRPTAAAAVLVPAIASLPLLMPFGLPPGPGNTGLPDLALVVLTATTLVWAASRRVPVRWPYLVPTLLTVVAGGIAAIANGVGPLTLVQDLFVLLWAVCLANLGRDPWLLRTALRAFVCLGTASALLMIVGYAAGLDALSGKQPDGERLQFTFGDANYAANWLICVLFIARAARFPETAWRRWAVCAVLIAAEVLTGSNGGALALIAATVAGGLWRMVREGRAHRAVAAGCLVALLGGGAAAALTRIDVQPYLDRASAASPILRDSIGRTTGESTESRSTVTAMTVRMIREQPHPWGIGPAQTEARTLRNQESYVREAHNDYIAAVLERGFLGGVALIVLVFLLLLECVRIARPGALDPAYARLVPRPELFGALVIVFLISGLFYEVLHYRHGWAFFGLIAAVELFGRRDPAAPGPAGPRAHREGAR